MKACSAFGRAALLTGILGLGAGAWAQAPDTKPQSATTQRASGPKKPIHRVEFVTTTDPVALLALRRAPGILETPMLPSVASRPNARTDNPVDEKSKKTAEIAETERLIQEKQKRIVLLLRLFATDEQMFLRDPSAVEKDAGIQERRKYSQDELLWETAELSRLKKRMNELEAMGVGSQ